MVPSIFYVPGEANGSFPADDFPARRIGFGAMWQFTAKIDGNLNEGSIPFTRSIDYQAFTKYVARM
jgi:hypothetical protein